MTLNLEEDKKIVKDFLTVTIKLFAISLVLNFIILTILVNLFEHAKITEMYNSEGYFFFLSFLGFLIFFIIRVVLEDINFVEKRTLKNSKKEILDPDLEIDGKQFNEFYNQFYKSNKS